jgi:hypothetical protein
VHTVGEHPPDFLVVLRSTLAPVPAPDSVAPPTLPVVPAVGASALSWSVPPAGSLAALAQSPTRLTGPDRRPFSERIRDTLQKLDAAEQTLQRINV